MALPFYFRSLAFDRWNEGDKLSRGAWSSVWAEYAREDPKLAGVFVCIELVFGGDKVVRVATRGIESVSGTTGDVYRYTPALQSEPSIRSEISLRGGKASLRSFTISLDARLVDPLEIVNSGRILAGWGEVSLQYDGCDYDSRIVLMRGDMSGGVDFGRKEEIVTFEIVDPELTTDRQIPPYIATLQSLPDLAESDVGRRYPIVLSRHPFVPCIRTTTDRNVAIFGYHTEYLVCYGHGYTVTLIYTEGYSDTIGVPSSGGYGGAFEWFVAEVYDSNGVPYTAVRFRGSATNFDESTSVYAEVEGPEPLSLIQAVKRIVEDYSENGARGVDYDALGVSETRVPGFASPRILINGSGSGNTTRALEYLESTLSEDFPMLSFAYTGRGYGPVVVDRTSGVYVADLVRGQYPLIDRVSDISEAPKSDLANSFVYRYAANLFTDSLEGLVSRGPDSSLLCRISTEMAGRRDGDVLEAVTVYDESTANYIANWLVAHFSLPFYVVEYEAFPLLALTLRLGDNVYLSDDRLSWSKVPATVMALEYAKGRAVVRFFVWLLYSNLSGGAESGTGITFGGGSPPQGQSVTGSNVPGANQPGVND